MQATLNPASNDPHDVLEIAPDIVLVARAEHELSKLARDAKARAPQSSQPPQLNQGPTFTEDASVPPIDTGFRATAINRKRPSTAGRAIRSFVGLLLAVLIGGAVLTLKVSGDVAQQVIAAWLPSFAARSAPADDATPPQDQNAPAAQQAAATATTSAPQATPADTSAQANAAPAVAPATAQGGAAPASAASAPPVDQGQMMQTMAHRLASVGQELEELKAQLAELKASQDQMKEQMSRDMAKAAEPKVKLSAIPARPAAPVRKPPPVFRPAPAAVAPPPPPPPAQQAYVPPPPPAASSPYAPPPQAAPQAPYDPNAPRPPLPLPTRE